MVDLLDAYCRGAGYYCNRQKRAIRQPHMRHLVLGTRDYVRKCGFKKVLVGLSGGIDSALVAADYKDALGAENVFAIGMPSRLTLRAGGSIDDSRKLAA